MERPKIRFVHSLSIFFLIVILQILFSCNPCVLGTQVTVPASDNTPPTLAGLVASFENGDPHVSADNTSGGQTVQVLNGNKINFLATAGDPEGSKAVKVWIEITGHRTSQVIGPGLLSAPEDEKVVSANPGDEVCTHLRLSFDYIIEENYDWSTYRVWTEAINSANQSVISQSISFETPH